MDESWKATFLGLAVCVGLCALWWFNTHCLKRCWEKGCAAFQSGDLESAERYLRKCLKKAPSSAAARQVLGAVLARRDKLEEAEEHYVMAAKLEPRNEAPQMHLGFFLALCVKDRAEDAIDAFTRAVEIAPTVRKQLAREPRLAPLRTHARFNTLVSPNAEDTHVATDKI